MSIYTGKLNDEEICTEDKQIDLEFKRAWMTEYLTQPLVDRSTVKSLIFKDM